MTRTWRELQRERDGTPPEAAPMTLPYQSHSPTSREAARSMVGDAGTQRTRVHRMLAARGRATDEELQELCGLNPSAERPRRIELCRMGIVRDSGERGLTRSGRRAVLWELVTP